MVDRISDKNGLIGTFAAKNRRDKAAGSNQKSSKSEQAFLELESRLRAVLGVRVTDQDTKRALVLGLIDSLGIDFVDLAVKESLIERVLQKFKAHSELGVKMTVLVEELRNKSI